MGNNSNTKSTTAASAPRPHGARADRQTTAASAASISSARSARTATGNNKAIEGSR